MSLAGTFSRSLALSVAGAAMGFLGTVVLTRTLGPETFGILAFAMGLMGFASIFTTLGFHHLTVREIPRLEVLGDPGEVAGLVAVAFAAALGASLLAAGVGVLASGPLDANGIGGAELGWLLLVMALATLNTVRQGCVRGVGRPVAGQAPELLVAPGVFLVGVAALAAAGRLATVETALLVMVVSQLAAFAAGFVPFWRHVLAPRLVRPRLRLGRWIAEALKSSLINTGAVLLATTDVVMLGFLSTPAETADYAIAARFGLMMALPVAAMAAAVSHRVAALAAAGDLAGVAATARQSSSLALLMSMAIAAGACAVAPFTEAIFGAGYAGAALCIVTLTLGRALEACIGQPQVVLANAGATGQAAVVLGGVCVLNAGLNLWLVPVYGAIGAASATVLAHLALGALSWLRLRRLLGAPTTPNLAAALGALR